MGGQDSQSAIVSLDLAQKELASVSGALEHAEIVGKIVDIQIAEPLHDNSKIPKKVLRLSAHLYNSESDLQHLKEVIARVL